MNHQFNNQLKKNSVSRFGISTPSQRRILLAILLSFTGYYFLRTNLTICLGTIIDSLPGVDKSQFGAVLSFGYFFYAIGKFICGILIDHYGGAPIFISGLIGSIFASILFTLIPYPVKSTEKPDMDEIHWLMLLFGVTWSLNRLAQSAGWGGLVKMVSVWFPASVHGRILGLATLSYGLGDVLIRLFLGAILGVVTPEVVTLESSGRAWRLVYYVSIMMATMLLFPSLFWLRSAPAISLDNEDTDEYGSSEIPISASNSSSESSIKDSLDSSYHKEQKPRTSTNRSTIVTLRRLLRLPKFWILLIMSPCLSLIRETITSWAIVYFSDTFAMPAGDAAMMSMLFPLFGTLSTLIGGWTIDNVLPSRRGIIPVICLSGLTALLITASLTSPLGMKSGDYGAIPVDVSASGGSRALGAFMLSLIALMLMAPFSFVDGVFVLSLAGKYGTGVAVGLLNAVGYSGAILAGGEMGSVAQMKGWPAVFSVLALVSFISTIMSILYWVIDRRESSIVRSGSWEQVSVNDDSVSSGEKLKSAPTLSGSTSKSVRI